MVLISADGNPTMTTPATGFSVIGTGRWVSGTANTLFAYGKTAAGGEQSTTLTFTLSASEQGVVKAYVIRGSGGTVADIFAATATTGTTAVADAGSANHPNYGAVDFLAVVAASWDGGARTLTTGATNYTANQDYQSPGNAANGATLYASYRAITATGAEDPGAITQSAADDWVAVTFQIPPETILFAEDFEGRGTSPADGTAMSATNTFWDLFNGVGTRTFQSAAPAANAGLRRGEYAIGASGQAVTKDTNSLPGATNGGTAQKIIRCRWYWRNPTATGLPSGDSRTCTFEDSVASGGNDVASITEKSDGTLRLVNGTTQNSTGTSHPVGAHTHWHRIEWLIDMANGYQELEIWWAGDKDSVSSGASLYEKITYTTNTAANPIEVFGLGCFNGVSVTNGFDGFVVKTGASLVGPDAVSTDVNAEVAAATAAALDVLNFIKPNTAVATAVGAALNATVSTGTFASAGVASATSVSQTAQGSVKATAAVVAIGGAALVTQSSVKATAALVSVTALANNTTITRSDNISVNAGAALATSQAFTAQGGIKPNTTAATATAAALVTQTTIKPQGGLASGVGAANAPNGTVASPVGNALAVSSALQATVTTSAGTTVSAGVASATSQGLTAQAGVKATAGLASASAQGFTAQAGVKATAGLVSVATTAHTTQSNVKATAEYAIATGLVSNASVNTGGPKFVQQATAADNAGATSLTVPIAATTLGNCLVATIGVRTDTTTPVTGITDNGGNTWQLAVETHPGSGSSTRTETWYCLKAASTTSIVITMGGTHKIAANIQEYSGVADIIALDRTNGQSAATVTSLPTGQITPSVEQALIVAAINASTAGGTRTFTSGSPWVELTRYGTTGGSDVFGSAAYRVLATPAAVEAAWSQSSAVNYSGNTIALLPVAAGIKKYRWDRTQSSTTYGVDYYGNTDLAVGDALATHAIISIHGASRTAAAYADYAMQVPRNTEHEATTVVVAPHFKANTEAGASDLWWAGGWDQGDLSQGDDPGEVNYPVVWRYSTFAVLDDMLASLKNSGLYPNLKRIAIVGFSGGGQYVNRFAVGSQVAPSAGMTFGYGVYSPSSYMYLNPKRYDSTPTWRVLTGPEQAATPGWDDYKYGQQAPNAYMAAVSAATQRSTYFGRQVKYLVGSADTNPADPELDVSAEAGWQGTQRVDRSNKFFNSLAEADIYGLTPPTHSRQVVSGAGHSPSVVITSTESVNFIYAAQAGVAGASGAANNASVSVSAAVNVSAGVATASAQALVVQGSIKPSAGNALAVSAALVTQSSVKATAEVASVTVTSLNALPSIPVTVTAGLASATGVAQTPNASIKVTPASQLFRNSRIELASTANLTGSGNTYDGAVLFNSHGTVKMPVGSTSTISDDFIRISPDLTYRLQVALKTDVVAGQFYAGFAPYDPDGFLISPYMSFWQANTLTTLAADLNPGDTTMTLTSSANWHNGANSAQRLIGFWDYVDGQGYAYPPLTYTRNVGTSGYYTYAQGGISGNVVTLGNVYGGPKRLAGTQVSNMSSAGSFLYTPGSGINWPNTNFQTLVGTVGGGYETGSGWGTGKFPQATKSIRVIYLNLNNPTGAMWIGESPITTDAPVLVWTEALRATTTVKAAGGLASASGAANGATVTRSDNISVSAGVASASAVANSATVSTSSAINVSAGVASASDQSLVAQGNIKPTAAVASAVGTAQTARGAVGASAIQATAATQALGVQGNVKASADNALSTDAALVTQSSVKATAGVASATGAANNTTVITSGNTSVSAGNAAATSAALVAQSNVKASAGVASATGVANNTTVITSGNTSVNAGVATSTVTAHNPVVSTSGATNVSAGTASATALANNTTVITSGNTSVSAQVATASAQALVTQSSIKPNAVVASASTQALVAQENVKATAGFASVTDAALNTTVITSGNTSVSAGVATASAQALITQSSVKATAGLASVAGSAHNTTVTTSGNTLVNAGVASATAIAHSPTVTRSDNISVSAGLASATAVAISPVVSTTGATNVSAGTASATTQALVTQSNVKSTASAASATGVAQTAQGSVGASAGIASATSSALNASVIVSGNTSVSAQAALATGASLTAQGSVKATAGVASASALANNTTVTHSDRINVTAGVASATGIANNPVISTSGATNVSAGTASASALANNTTVITSGNTSPSAGVATANTQALVTQSSVKATATAASAVSTGQTAQGNVSVNAGVASAAGSALNPTVITSGRTSVNAGVATSSSIAYNANLSITGVANANAGVATATSIATPALASAASAPFTFAPLISF